MDIRTNYDHRKVAASTEFDRVHAEMRASCPVAHTDAYDGFWVMTRYADVVAATRDTTTFSSLPTVTIPSVGAPRPFIPVESDPPEHQKYRSLLNSIFRPMRIEGFESRIREQVVLLIEKIKTKHQIDLAADLMFPLTSRIITWFLGIPEEDVPQFSAWSLGLITVSSPEEGLRLQMEIRDYYIRLIEARKTEPGDDLATHLLGSTIDGRAVTEDEVLDLYLTLTGAGGETTAAMGNHIFWLLAQHPELRRRLASDRSLIPTAIEEFVRYVSPVYGFARNATRDVEVVGTEIKKGDRVFLSWLSANHDPEQFPDAETLVLDRAPNPHLGFGAGPHRCPGSPLARLTLRVLLEEVLDRIPDYQLVDPEAVTIAEGVTRVLRSLPAIIPSSA
ncbi:cytochrome P450 [Prauserella flavalba]|uniref:cytochrome P450 n=1 Tax=Prauserella flavalba TaxID=1477506 RepID=UPI0036E4BCEC